MKLGREERVYVVGLKKLQGEKRMYKILVVDDEPLICKGLAGLLNGSGIDIGAVYTAYSGHEALDYIRMEEIDLLVTDIQMGEMSGIEFRITSYNVCYTKLLRFPCVRGYGA